MYSRCKWMVVCSLAVWLAQPVLAQRGFFGGGAGSPVMLLQNPSVQKELKLSDEQIAKIKDANQQVRDKHKDELANIRNLDRQERGEKMAALFKTMAEETTKALKGVLSAGQEKRLKQISLQQRGADAFKDPEVEKKLNLTDDQKDKIKTITEDASKETREIFQNAQGNFQEAGRKFAALRKETLEKVTSVLTGEQKKTWKELTGKPFEIKFERRRPRQRNGQ